MNYARAMARVAIAPGNNVGDMPRPSEDAFAVRDVLRAPSLAGTKVLAGEIGLDRPVRRLNVMEVPDILPWVKPHELLLTTAFAVTRADASKHTALLIDLVTNLNARQLSGLGVKLGRYLDEVPQEVLSRADQLGFPVLRLPDRVAFDEVLTEVFTELLDRQSHALAQADAFHRAISAIVLAGGELPQIAEEVARLLDCLVLITTPEGRLLAERGPAFQRSAAERAQLFDPLGQRVVVERLRTGIHRVPTRSDKVPYGTSRRGYVAMTSIVAGAVDHGRIVAYRSESNPPAAAVQILERAAIVVALTITNRLAVAAVEAKFRGDYLHDLLTGLLSADDDVVEHCQSIGWDIDRPLVVAVALPDQVVGASASPGSAFPAAQQRSHLEQLTAAWAQVMQARDKSAPVVGFNHEVVALLGVGHDAARTVAEVTAAVSAHRPKAARTFTTGVSRIVTMPSQIPAAYAQARQAVMVGRRMQGPGSVVHFDSLGIHRLFSLVLNPGELTSFAIELLGDLAGNDAKAADLRSTLQTLLDTNLNVAETARLLHFHYNTLRNRVAKLERMIGPFSSDPDLRLNVAVALQIMQLRGIQETSVSPRKSSTIAAPSVRQ
ncbi:MAG TPA: PucR family transcriptional regulator ligand-binding domain-containing protein [Gemmatimonadaceae bacterium]|nr:PucR family transcriptional regulator ligand-binding domain-containing protein [Gemmatimonadaceae bacterium]